MKAMVKHLCHDIFHSEQESDPQASLTETEISLLTESLPSGHFFIFESAHLGCHVATSEKHWFSETDECYQEYVVHAFRSLCKKGFIRHTNLCMFQLSHHGSKVARQLVREAANEFIGCSK